MNPLFFPRASPLRTTQLHILLRAGCDLAAALRGWAERVEALAWWPHQGSDQTWLGNPHEKWSFIAGHWPPEGTLKHIIMRWEDTMNHELAIYCRIAEICRMTTMTCDTTSRGKLWDVIRSLMNFYSHLKLMLDIPMDLMGGHGQTSTRTPLYSLLLGRGNHPWNVLKRLHLPSGDFLFFPNHHLGRCGLGKLQQLSGRKQY